MDTSSFIDYSTGNVWQGNSSFETITSGFRPHRAEREHAHEHHERRCRRGALRRGHALAPLQDQDEHLHPPRR